MYAIVETGGKQYRVKPGDTIAVERVAGEPGEVLDLGRVLLVAGDGDTARVGSPGVPGAVVRAEVVEHARGEKIVVFRYKSKVRYRRKTGHRQALTRLRITDILLDGHSAATAQTTPAEPVAEQAPTPRPGADRASVASAPAETGAANRETELPPSAGEAGPPPDEQQTEQTGPRQTEEA
jgi:large subunit ribosomal protein L21